MKEKNEPKKQTEEIIDWETAVGEKKAKKKMPLKKKLICGGVAICILVSMYLTIVYSNIPFIAKWRTIYIETAMTTNSHQWLATLFFPQSVIDEVMANRQKNLDAQANVESQWDEKEGAAEKNTELEKFFETYWELDTEAFRNYLTLHPALTKNGYDDIFIENMNNKYNLKTKDGDPLLILDSANNLMIVGIHGEGYQGKLAIIKDASQVDMVKSKAIGSFGQEAGSFGEDYDALLVINASGFVDVDGVGTGGEVKGSMIIDGIEYGSHYDEEGWKFCGLKKNNLMYVRNYPADDVSNYRWGMEFLPALIVDGKSVVDGTFGMGIQPRAALGQSKKGDILMLIVDGRQVGYSIGCTVEDCKDILLRYGAYQGMNLDGGSSAVMWYNGSYITKSSSVSGIGRYMPNALIVKKKKNRSVTN